MLRMLVWHHVSDSSSQVHQDVLCCLSKLVEQDEGGSCSGFARSVGIACSSKSLASNGVFECTQPLQHPTGAVITSEFSKRSAQRCANNAVACWRWKQGFRVDYRLASSVLG